MTILRAECRRCSTAKECIYSGLVCCSFKSVDEKKSFWHAATLRMLVSEPNSGFVGGTTGYTDVTNPGHC